MKKYLFLTLPLLVVISIFQSASAAVTYPSFVPAGEHTGGVFTRNFFNMYSGSSITDTVLDYSKGCANPNEVVRGFTSTGILLCILTSSSTTSGFTGALVGIQHFVPRYSASGTGIINSQIYDNSGATVIIGTGITVATPTRLEVKNGGMLVDDIVVGRGNNRIIGNTAIGQGALVLASGMNNTVLGYLAGANITTGTNNIAIGYNAQVPNNTGNDQLSIGNAIYGVGVTGVAGAGNIGIGVTNPTAKLEIAGQVKIIDGFQGLNKVLVSDATGLATWQTFIAGSAYATGLIIPPGSNNYLAKFNPTGTGIIQSVVYESGGNIGIGMTSPGAKLEIAGQIKITGGSPGVGKMLASDATGLATWSPVVLTGGTANYIARWLTSTGLTIGLIYDNGTNVGIGTSSPTTRLEIDSGIANVAGLRFTRLNSGSLLYTGGVTIPLGFTSSGYVVPVQGGMIPVYTALGGTPNSAINISASPPTIGANYDKYFNITARQSFVVTDVGGNPYNCPEFNIGTINKGTTGCTATPWASYVMTAQNDTTGNRYGYQILISDRTDAPFVVRGGMYSSTTGTLMNTAMTSNALWFKALTVPTNHSDWLYVNPGVDQNNNPIVGGGNIGFGNMNPDFHLDIDGSEATAKTQVQISRNIQSTLYGRPFLRFGINAGSAIGNLQTIGFGRSSNSGELSAAEIGFITTSTAGSTQGDIVFANRNVTTNTAPTEVVRIRGNGNVGIGTNNPGARIHVNGNSIFSGTVRISGGAPAVGRVLTSTNASGDATWQIPGTQVCPGGGIGNTCYGSGAGSSLAAGGYNTAIGVNAIRLNSTGVGNVGVGSGAGSNLTTGSNNIAIGSNTSFLSATASNQLNIGNWIYGSGGNIGIGTNAPTYRLQVAGTGSFYGLRVSSGAVAGYVLTSDASGNATWGFVAAASATGIISGTGTANYLSKFGPTGTGIFASVVYETGSRIGIGTNTPGAKLEINSGIPNTSGLRFTNLNSSTTPYTGGVITVGLNNSGDLVPISPISNIAVYNAINPASPPVPNPDLANQQISYDFNNYFAINTKQSFVVSNGDDLAYNAPYFSENAPSSICSSTTFSGSTNCSTFDTIRPTEFASPFNSFTMSAKSNRYGYQLALGARGDAPLFARVGKFLTGAETNGLYLDNYTTSSPWYKILAFPANHPEYLYINTGIDSQLRTQSGGGQVAIGTTMPNSRFEIWTGASTAPLMHFRGNGNVALGLNALNTATGLTVTTLHSYNTAVGYAAGSGMTTGSNNIFLGADTRTLTGNISNTLNIGNTLFANNIPTTYTGSAGYVGIGTRAPNQQLELTQSMRLPTTTSNTTGVIYKDGNRFIHNYEGGTNPGTSTFLGLNAGNFTLTSAAVGNTGIGRDTLMSLTTGAYNTALGKSALQSNTGASYNTAIGYEALYNNIARDNVAVGYAPLRTNTTGQYNTAVGNYSMYNTTTAWRNTANGYQSLYNNTWGSENTANGAYAMYNNTTGQYNTANGSYSMYSNSTGSYNSANGYRSLYGNTVGSNNATDGAYSMYSNTVGSNNSANGYGALYGNTLGSSNTAIGYQALYGNTTGSGNTALGYNAGSNITTGQNNISIGYNTTVPNATASNQLSIGNWIYGINNGDIGIGTSAPTAKFHVNGTTRLAGNTIVVGDSSVTGNMDIAGNLTITGSIRIAGGSPTGGAILTYDAVSGFAKWSSGSGATLNPWSIYGNTGTSVASGHFLGTIDAQDFVIKTDNTERVRITAGGNLGLGTNNPGSYTFYNSGTSYFRDDITIRSTNNIGFTNTSTTGSTSGINWQNSGGSGPATTSVYVEKTGWIKNSLISKMESDNRADEFVWIHDRTTGTGYDATPMRLAAHLGNFYSGAMIISNPLPWGNRQVGFNTSPGVYGMTAPTVDVSGKIRINYGGGDTSGYVLVSDQYGIGTWTQLANSGSTGYWKLIGNTGTTVGSGNFLGTIDNSDFLIKANSQPKILVSATTSNLTLFGDTNFGRGGGNQGSNIALGNQALQLNSLGANNTAIGYFSLRDNTTSSNNTSVGFESMRFNQTGSANTSFGVQSLYTNLFGSNNTAIGYQALYTNSGTSANNTAIGYQALYSNNGGSSNLAIGYLAGNTVTTGGNNTIIGYQAGNTITTGSSNIAIGSSANVFDGTLSNQLSIGNLIFGNGLTGTVGAPAGNIGIGANNPTARLDIDGSFRVRSAGTPLAGKVLTSTDALGNVSWQNVPGSTTEWSQGGNTVSAGSGILGTKNAEDLLFRTNNIDRVRITSAGNFGLGAVPGTYMFYNNGTSFFNNTIDVAATRFMNFATSGVGNTSGISWTNNNDPARIYVSETLSNKSEMVFQIGDDSKGGAAISERFVFKLPGGVPANDVYPMTLGDLFGNFYGNSMVIDSTTGGTGFGKTPGAGLRVDINGATAIAGNTTISGATSILGNTTITGATTIAGKLSIIDGSQSSGALFTSNGSGVGTWIVPVAEQKTEWKYRAQNIQSNNNGVLSNHTELISAVLPALGSSDGYSFEVVGNYQSNNLNNGLSVTMNTTCPGSIYDFIGSAKINTGNGLSYKGGFMTPATSTTSTGVTAINTYYPFSLKGTFRNTANCSIQFQFASENNGNTTTIGSGAYMIIRLIKKEVPYIGS